MATEQQWAAFQGERCIATGSPKEVATAVKVTSEEGARDPILVFNDATGRLVDLDLRGAVEDVLARLPAAACEVAVEAPSRGPGRPKLGVVSREVTLLPRHWEWLGEQPGGASVALRKLVDAARTSNVGQDRVRRAREATDRFMSAMAGNRVGYEEAARALYAGNRGRFEEHIQTWPPDIRSHVRYLAHGAFESSADADA